MRLAPTLAALLLGLAPAWAQLGLEGPGSSSGAPPAASPPPVEVPAFRLGFNQGWWKTAYGRQWTGELDEGHVDEMVAATARFAGPGAVLRVWLFEGADPGGVLWDGEAAPGGRAPTDAHRTRPTGLDPAVLANLERFLERCEAHGVQAYLTLFDGNVSDFSPRAHRKAEYWNVLNEKYGAAEGFREAVLGPVLEVAARHRGAIFGLDLCNEVNNLVSDHWFEDGWTGAVRFVRRWRTFARARVPGLAVTASLGHHTAVRDMVEGRLSRGAVDFYDFHAYNDGGWVRQADDVRALAAEVPVYLGEFGQSSKSYDDALQAKVTGAFLATARRLGLRGAFAWRLWDVRPGENPEARLSFYAHGAWRPAASALR